MNIIDIINKKRNKESLNNLEIDFAVNGFVNGKIEDYQMSSLLMAIVINGMSEEETIYLTEAMIKSGNIMDLNDIEGVKVDKHSTGGVGDKTTLIVAPLVAACNLNVAKLSGRGLGHTGGTIDKLESIPGFNVNLNEKEFIKQVNDINIALASQTNNLVPADKKIYALRDVTGTVSSIPLIASSIMSKKLATSTDVIVLDVKVGKGAIVKSMEEAHLLASLMVKIGNSFGKKTVAILSDMDEPLGCAIGNALEVEEAIRILKGEGDEDITKLCVTLATLMVTLGKNISYKEARELVLEKLHNKEAYHKFLEWIKYQHGNIDELKISDKVISIKSQKTGYIQSIDALKLGEIARNIGAGRLRKEDKIDYSVGILLSKKVGDYVLENEELLKIYLSTKDVNLKEIIETYEIGPEYKEPNKLIIDLVK